MGGPIREIIASVSVRLFISSGEELGVENTGSIGLEDSDKGEDLSLFKAEEVGELISGDEKFFRSQWGDPDGAISGRGTGIGFKGSCSGIYSIALAT